MVSEKKEKTILMMSFISGFAFAIAEFLFAIFSHSQSSLTDAVYDMSELVFIALLLFLTPLFHKPVSEKYPYGFFQVESIFVLIKGVMMLSVTLGICGQVIESALSGGNLINNNAVSGFQLCLGIASVIIYLVMKRLGKSLNSPTIEAELLGWKLDIYYSLGLSFAFFAANYLSASPLAFIAPYFDQIIAVIVMVCMIPESAKILVQSIKEVFLFPPDDNLIDEMKQLLTPVLDKYEFEPVFFDITKTGRHLWVGVYFKISGEHLSVTKLDEALKICNEIVDTNYGEATCELIVVPNED